MRIPALALLLAAACTPEGSTPDASATCAAGDDHVVVLTKIAFVRSNDGVSEGFDLDETVTQAGDGTGCGMADDVAPDGTPGIDNAFASIVPVLELTEARALETILIDAINAGQLLLVLNVTGVDDLVDDACVGLEVLRARGVPQVSAAGSLVADQTLARDEEVPSTTIDDLAIREGVLDAGPFLFNLPVSVLNRTFDIVVLDAHVRVSFDAEGGVHGVLGGGIDVESLLAQVKIASEDAYAAIGPLISSLADLGPDEQGVCGRLSITLEIEGVRGFLFEEPADGGAATP